MIAKKRGTFNIDRNITPKDNICNLLKQVYPVEVTLSKMNPQKFDHDRYYSHDETNNTVLLQNVDVFPINKYNLRSGRRVWMMGDNPTPQDIFARVGFGLKTNSKYCNRRGRDGYVARWSVPIKNEKISIGKVVSIFEEMKDITKEIADNDIKHEEEKKIKEAMQQAKAQYVQEVNNLAGKHPNMRIESQGYHNKMPSHFRVDVSSVTKAQAIAIGQAVIKIMADPALTEPEIKDDVNV